MRKRMPGMMLYLDDVYALRRYSDEQFGKLIRALAGYTDTEEIVEPDDSSLEGVFYMMLQKIDRDRERYEAVSRKRAEAARRSHGHRDQGEDQEAQPLQPMLRMQPTVNVTETVTETVTENVTQKGEVTVTQSAGEGDGENRETCAKRQRFAPPSPEEVRDYAIQMNYEGFNADAFVSFYTAKGWQVGRNPMQDWRAAVRSWQSRDKPAPAACAPKVYRDFDPETDW